jgi:hypothetical protein
MRFRLSECNEDVCCRLLTFLLYCVNNSYNLYVYNFLSAFVRLRRLIDLAEYSTIITVKC